jgi:photosystem II stability/assembly factor-like uncharacterized protein
MPWPDHGWAVGEYGALYHWDGERWSPTYSPTRFDYNGVVMVSETDGWIVGEDWGSRGVILRYAVP